MQGTQGMHPCGAMMSQPMVQSNVSAGGRQEGTVREWSARGFGFIVLDDDRRVYVHHSSVVDCTGEDGKVNLERGQPVSAIIVEDTQNPGKWAANDVRKISKLSSPEQQQLL